MRFNVENNIQKIYTGRNHFLEKWGIISGQPVFERNVAMDITGTSVKGIVIKDPHVFCTSSDERAVYRFNYSLERIDKWLV